MSLVFRLLDCWETDSILVSSLAPLFISALHFSCPALCPLFLPLALFPFPPAPCPLPPPTSTSIRALPALIDRHRLELMKVIV